MNYTCQETLCVPNQIHTQSFKQCPFKAPDSPQTLDSLALSFSLMIYSDRANHARRSTMGATRVFATGSAPSAVAEGSEGHSFTSTSGFFSPGPDVNLSLAT